uniref:Uncharacterized protein n=1 Tax=Oryza brachyantha TaxID=4533 RepID=J3LWH2_ORYBR
MLLIQNIRFLLFGTMVVFQTSMSENISLTIEQEGKTVIRENGVPNSSDLKIHRIHGPVRAPLGIKFSPLSFGGIPKPLAIVSVPSNDSSVSCYELGKLGDTMPLTSWKITAWETKPCITILNSIVFHTELWYSTPNKLKTQNSL